MKEIFFAVFMVCAFVLGAQGRHSMSTDYENGKLSFGYYLMDGVKIPDGHMEYVRKSKNEINSPTLYKESGENKDGYKEGVWRIEASSPNRKYEIIMNYKKGLLDGSYISREYQVAKDEGAFVLIKEQSFKFRYGHLIGNNVFVNNSDTLYFSYDDNGKRTGEWRLCKPNLKTKAGTFEYMGVDKESYDARDKYEVINVYEMDILGQKIPNDNHSFDFYMDVISPLISFKQALQSDPTSIWRQKRVTLPSLHDNKWGFIDNF